MEPTFHFRRATTADLPELYNFEQMVVEAERPYDPTLKKSGVKYYDLVGMLADEKNVFVAVAVEGASIIATGYARIEVAKQRYVFERYAYLGFMCVLPSHRGRGVIQKLISYLQEWVSAQGIEEMRLHVYAENASAIRAYEQFGFQPYMQEMRLAIPKSQTGASSS